MWELLKILRINEISHVCAAPCHLHQHPQFKYEVEKCTCMYLWMQITFRPYKAYTCTMYFLSPAIRWSWLVGSKSLSCCMSETHMMISWRFWSVITAGCHEFWCIALLATRQQPFSTWALGFTLESQVHVSMHNIPSQAVRNSPLSLRLKR